MNVREEEPWHDAWQRQKHSARSGSVVSDGTEQRPHCSWQYHCNWDEGSKKICAKWLCKASGYKDGNFVRSSGDPCQGSFFEGEGWFVEMDEHRFLKGWHNKDAQ